MCFIKNKVSLYVSINYKNRDALRTYINSSIFWNITSLGNLWIFKSVSIAQSFGCSIVYSFSQAKVLIVWDFFVIWFHCFNYSSSNSVGALSLFGPFSWLSSCYETCSVILREYWLHNCGNLSLLEFYICKLSYTLSYFQFLIFRFTSQADIMTDWSEILFSDILDFIWL